MTSMNLFSSSTHHLSCVLLFDLISFISVSILYFVHCCIILIDEWIFDSSYGHATPNRPPASSKQKDSKHSSSVGEPISLVLGKGSMIEGWECALRCMEKGECAEVIIKAA